MYVYVCTYKRQNIHNAYRHNIHKDLGARMMMMIVLLTVFSETNFVLWGREHLHNRQRIRVQGLSEHLPHNRRRSTRVGLARAECSAGLCATEQQGPVKNRFAASLGFPCPKQLPKLQFRVQG